MQLNSLRRRVKKARTAIRLWQDDAEREEAERMLDGVLAVFETEPDIFTKRDFIIGFADHRRVGERVLAVLETG